MSLLRLQHANVVRYLGFNCLSDEASVQISVSFYCLITVLKPGNCN